MPRQTRYQAIAEELRQQVESGALPRESQLPTEAELQKRFGASRNTVRDAVKLLMHERLLETSGHTVIQVLRTSFAADNTPIRVTVTVYPADRNQIFYDIGRVPENLEPQD